MIRKNPNRDDVELRPARRTTDIRNSPRSALSHKRLPAVRKDRYQLAENVPLMVADRIN